MGSREGFDLFSKWGRVHFWRCVRRRELRWAMRYVWRDTFGRFDCMVRGHRLETARAYDDRSGSWPCFRCNKYVPVREAGGGNAPE